jgi:two-component system, chemotaxis family, chemotaxis protein CheY
MFAKDSYFLVVDDSINIRQIICENLRRLGFIKMETAGDANEAFSKLVQQSRTNSPFTIILSDLNMPGPSGIDFLKQIRDTDKFKELPFILITTESEKQAVIQAAMAGVSAYIVKPFNVEILTKRLQEAWRKHHPPAAQP